MRLFGRISLSSRRVLVALGLITAPAVAGPVISEFMASNATSFRDGNGKYEDWVEIWNNGPDAVNLAGWRLTDSATNPNKFVFPSLPLAAGQRLVVFCSSRAGSTGAATYFDPAGNPHTPFALAAGGEYLALLRPDGIKATEFAPSFPPQSPDMSYGTAHPTAELIGPSSTCRFLVPVNGAQDTANPDWTRIAYNDTGWTASAGPGLGFESGTPVAYWPFDEAAGAAVAQDATGNGNHGSAHGTAAFGENGRAEQTGQAVSFGPAIGRISVPHSPALNPSTFTFAAWVRPSAASGSFQSIVTSRRQASPSIGYILYITPGGLWSFWTRGTSGGWSELNGPAVAFGQWSHVAISRDASGTNRLFVNGNEVAAAPGSYAPNSTSPLHLGAGNHDGTQFPFHGRIDDATLWNTALPATLVQQHRDSTGGSFPTPAYTGQYQTNVQSVLETVNPGLYTRYSFQVADPAALTGLSLRMKYDDGFVAYLNGTEIARRHLAGVRGFDATSDTDRGDSEAVEWDTEDVTTVGVPALATGTNVLAVHGFRRSLAHTDFLLQPRLDAAYGSGATRGYFERATPGAAESAFVSPGPEIDEVSHVPAEPLPGEPITVTARVTPRLGPIQSVRLVSRVQYLAEAAPVTMTDSGPWPGATDGSRSFTATLPNGGGAAARQMLRYFITATDTSSRTWRSPFISDSTNDDGKSQSPQYHGTVIRDSSLGSPAMPIVQWFTADVPNSDTRVGSRASCFHGGKLYDNIYVRQRGGYTSAGSQKFNFNRGHGLVVEGLPGTLGEVNMNSNGADPTFLRPLLAFDLWSRHGHPASDARLVALYRNGSFQRMSSMIEQVDEDFLDRHGLDEDGALYKFVQRIGETPLPGGNYSNSPALGDTLHGVEKKTRLNEGFSDLNAFVAGIGQTDPAARDAFLFRHLNIPNFVNFMAIRNLTGDADTNRKNFYMHRDSEGSGEWRLIPWDKDFTFGVAYDQNIANPWQATQTHYHDPGGTRQWCVLFEAGLQNQWIRAMVARRIRAIADATIGAPGQPVAGTLYDSRLEALRATFTPLPAGVAMSANYNNRSGLDSWLATHRNHTHVTYGPGGAFGFVAAAASPSPVIEITGADALPATGTGQEHEFIRLSNPGPESVDVSGWTLWNPGRATPFFVFPPGSVIPGPLLAPLHQPYVARDLAAFRSRPGAAALEFVLGEYSGQLSARGETIELRDGPSPASRLVSSFTTPATPTAAQTSLRVTEIMFDPPAPTPSELAAAPGRSAGDFEFIELRNIGSSTLSLAGCAFTDGIDFTFPTLALAPGEQIVVARDPLAFAARYGASATITGPFSGALDNAGERIRLEDAVGETILDFSYEPGWFPPAAGGGRSLVARAATPAPSDYDSATGWAISGFAGGSPGEFEDGGFAHHYQGWLHDHFSSAEQLDPLVSGPSADPDGDGMNNLGEYAFAMDPRQPDAPAPVQVERSIVAGAAYLDISFLRPTRSMDLVSTIETTTSLDGADWEEASPLPLATLPAGRETESVGFRIPIPVDSGRFFARVRVRN